MSQRHNYGDDPSQYGVLYGEGPVAVVIHGGFWRDRYDLTLMDVRTTQREGAEVEGVQIADLLHDDTESLRRYFAGQDSVVHLAFNRAPDAAMSGAQRATRLTPGSPYEAERGNVDMAYRVL